MDWDYIVTIAIEVVIIFLVLFVLIVAQVLLAQDWPLTEIEADPLDVQTGDIVGIAYDNPVGWFVTAWTFSRWTHTGVIWRHPETNEPFVLEAANYGSKFKGVFRIPYHQWLRINRRHRLCHLRISQPLDPVRMSEEYARLEAIELDKFGPSWSRFLWTENYIDEPHDRHFTCFELTILLLQRLGVVQKERRCCSYFPRDIVWRHLPMETGYVYADPVLLRVTKIPN